MNENLPPVPLEAVQLVDRRICGGAEGARAHRRILFHVEARADVRPRLFQPRNNGDGPAPCGPPTFRFVRSTPDTNAGPMGSRANLPRLLNRIVGMWAGAWTWLRALVHARERTVSSLAAGSVTSSAGFRETA